MIKTFSKVLSVRVIRKFISSATSPFWIKMVRYFPNPYEDYAPGANTNPNYDDISSQIADYISNITKRLQPSRRSVDGGLYVGVTGIVFMFYRLSKNSLLSEHKHMYLENAQEFLQPALETPAGDKTSFLLGEAGTMAMTAVLYKALGDEKYVDALSRYKALHSRYLQPKFLKCGGDEFFVGRAGYLAGALWLTRELQTQVFTDEELYKICDVIVESGREYSQKHKSPCPLMYHYYNTEYLGAAHGISFIMQMLLSIPGYLEYNKTAANHIKSTVEYLMLLQTDEGNWPCCMEELNLTDHKLVHWCHGAPGTVYLMAKAYLVYKDDRYKVACEKAGDIVWEKGLLRKGPGICHGVSGNGYVFLLLYRLTGDEKHLFRAKQFANFMTTDDFLRDSRVPDSPESLYEGTAGAVCFLSDLLIPDTAEFPFQDVFST